MPPVPLDELLPAGLAGRVLPQLQQQTRARRGEQGIHREQRSARVTSAVAFRDRSRGSPVVNPHRGQNRPKKSRPGREIGPTTPVVPGRGGPRAGDGPRNSILSFALQQSSARPGGTARTDPSVRLPKTPFAPESVVLAPPPWRRSSLCSYPEGSSHGTVLVAALAEEVPAAVPPGPQQGPGEAIHAEPGGAGRPRSPGRDRDLQPGPGSVDRHRRRGRQH